LFLSFQNPLNGLPGTKIWNVQAWVLRLWWADPGCMRGAHQVTLSIPLLSWTGAEKKDKRSR